MTSRAGKEIAHVFQRCVNNDAQPLIPPDLREKPRSPVNSNVSPAMTLPTSRSALVATTTVAFAVAAAAVVWMFGTSLKPTEATVASHQLEVDVSTLPVGTVRRVEWEGFDVFVLRRAPAQISWLESYVPPVLGSHRSDEVPSERFMNRYRSASPSYLVVAVWKDRGEWRINESRSVVYRCADFRYSGEPVRISNEITFPGGFYCASMTFNGRNDFVGSPFVFDPAGRTVSPWYQPLSVPPHHFKGNNLVLDPQG